VASPWAHLYFSFNPIPRFPIIEGGPILPFGEKDLGILPDEPILENAIAGEDERQDEGRSMTRWEAGEAVHVPGPQPSA